MRLSLPTHVVRFLGATWNEAHCMGKFKPRGFVWLKVASVRKSLHAWAELDRARARASAAIAIANAK